MKAQCLYHTGGLLLQLSSHRLKIIGSKELSGILQRLHLGITFRNILLGNIAAGSIFFFHSQKDIFPAFFFKQSDDIVGNFVHHMDRTGTNIQNDIISTQLILMNHFFFSFTKKCRRDRRHFGVCNYLLSLALSHFWFAMPQLVLQADWQEVWHSPQPPFLALSHRLRVSMVLICSMVSPSILKFMQ